ncbi:hypothetical protein RRG08_000491 [Elysia crispata]|uniref:Uncharacterized protein n=1 Tax=Elysia crispata TaxID=231223 RepID=A0AAE0YCE1_9GAST|nr:hypothetical protein RRG08_000491 [Elysia crispata]
MPVGPRFMIFTPWHAQMRTEWCGKPGLGVLLLIRFRVCGQRLGITSADRGPRRTHTISFSMPEICLPRPIQILFHLGKHGGQTCAVRLPPPEGRPVVTVIGWFWPALCAGAEGEVINSLQHCLRL